MSTGGRFFRVEYRRTPTDAAADASSDWTRWATEPPEDTPDFSVEGLEVGVLYDFRAKLVDRETKEESDWFLFQAIEVDRPDGIPPDVSQLRFTKGDCVTWEMPMEVLDLRGFRLRHMPCAWDDWETAEPAHEEIVPHPPFLLCRVPKGRRQIMVKAVDADGNESETASKVILDRGPVDDQAEFLVRTRDEAALLFPGTLRGATAGSSTLLANLVGGAPGTQPMFGAGLEPWIPVDGAAPMIPFDPDGDFFAPVYGGHATWLPRQGSGRFFSEVAYQWIEYVWEFTVHCGEEGPRSVLSADVAVTAATGGYDLPWRLQYRRKCSLPWIPADPFSAMIPTDGTAEMLPSEPTRPWRPWPGRLLGAEVGVYEFRLLVPGGHERAQVSRLAVSLSSEARVLHVEGLSVPALGGTRVPPGEDEWRRILEVRIEPIGTAGVRHVPPIDKNRTKGPRLAAYDDTGAAVQQTVDVTVRGY